MQWRKHFKASERKEWLDELITKCLHPTLHITLNVFHANQKVNQTGCY
jgi:hypothetical protein